MTFLFECLTRILGLVTGGNLENMESSKPAQVVQAVTRKRSTGKKKAEYDTWSQARTMTPMNAETSTTDGFESELYLIEVFALYV